MGTDSPRIGSADPYEQLLELAEAEYALVDGGRLEELEALSARWNDLTTGLPARPPAEARASLQRLLAIHTQTGALLSARRAPLLGQLSSLAHAGRAAGGYARTTARPSRVDESA